MPICFRPTLTAAAIGASLLPISVCAQNAIDNIIVTASRTGVPLAETSASVTLINSEDIDRRQSAQLVELLRGQPGLAVSRQGALGSTTQLRVRGTEGNHVLVLIDGVEANDLAQSGEFNFAHLSSHGIERVEIVRGPQSALWGSDAMGGVINIISARGKDSSFSGYAEGGSFGTLNSGASLSAGGDNYHLRLNASLLDSDGTNISRQGDEDDSYRSESYSVLAGYDPMENLSLQASLRHLNAANDYDSVDFSTGLPADSDHYSETSQTYAHLQAKLNLMDDRWEHSLAVDGTLTDNDNFAFGATDTSTQGDKMRYTYQTTFYFEPLETAGLKQSLTLAAEREEEEFTQRGTASIYGDPNRDIAIDSNALIAEYRASLWQSLHLSASARQDNNDAFDDADTYRLGVAYQITDNTKLRAAYGTGIKNPNFTERFGYFTNFIGNPDLQPERSKSWEIGLDQRLWDNQASLSLTYFNDRLEDEINGFVYDPELFAFTSANVSGTSYRQGMEVSIAAQITTNLSLDASYSYVDATEPDASGIQTDEVRRPHNNAGLTLNYVWLDGRANLNLSAQYSGEQLDDFFPPYPRPQQRLSLDSYTLVSLAGSYLIGSGITLFARAENLLDEDYEEVYGYQPPGLAAYAGVRIEFGR